MAKRKQTPKNEVNFRIDPKEIDSIMEEMIAKSQFNFSDEEKSRFKEVLLEIDAFNHPWIPLLSIPQIEDLSAIERQTHEELTHHWRRVCFKRLCAHFSMLTQKQVDVLGSFQSDEFIEYYESLSRDERQVFTQTLDARKKRVLNEEFDFRMAEDYSWPVLEAELRTLEHVREHLKFLAGVYWFHSSKRTHRIPEHRLQEVHNLWADLELRGEIGHYPPSDSFPLFYRFIPQETRFDPLRDFLKDFGTWNGKIVWPHMVKDLARLIDRLFSDGPSSKAIMKPLKNRFKRAADWFTMAEKPVSPTSLQQSASAMNNSVDPSEPSEEIENLCSQLLNSSKEP
ncbi:hypothetical protein L0152_28195 [bacterium]|nr:hypothetical protein [bacterium]